MAIDNCQYSFRDLTMKVLPAHMERIRQELTNPHQMGKFGRHGQGIKTILHRLGRTDDFMGCYVLIENDTPIYVGVSRSVVSRLIQHVKGRTHFDASLAYRIACDRCPHQLQRKAAMKTPEFLKEFAKAKEYLRSLKVAFIGIDNDVELYLFEVYCSMELDTCQWNTFRTH